MNKVFSSGHASSLICQMGWTERDSLITLDVWLRHEQRRIVTINHPQGQFMTVSAVQCSEKKHVNQWQAMKISACHQWKSMTISIDHSQNQWHAIQKAFSRKITKKSSESPKKRQESITSKTKKNQEKPRKTIKTIGTSPKKQHQEEAQQDWAQPQAAPTTWEGAGGGDFFLWFNATWFGQFWALDDVLSLIWGEIEGHSQGLEPSWAPQVATGMTSLRPRLGVIPQLKSPPHRFQRLWKLRKVWSNLSINLQCPSIIQKCSVFSRKSSDINHI